MLKSILKYFGYIHIDDVKTLIKDEISVYKNTPPEPITKGDDFDKLSFKQKRVWWENRKILDDKAEVLRQLSYKL